MPRARRNTDTGDLELEDELQPTGPLLDAGDLDLEDPDFPDIVWTVKRVLTPDQMRSMGTREMETFVTKFRGPLDLSTVQQQLGGGRFHFYGKVGREMVKNKVITIEGEYRPVRISLDQTPIGNASSPVPQTDVSRPISVEDAVRRAVQRERRKAQAELERRERLEVERRLEMQIVELKQLIAQVGNRPAVEAKPERLKDLAETMLTLRQLSPEATAGMNPLDLLKAAREWMDQGIVLGEKREPGTSDGGDGWNAERVTAVAQAVAQILQRFIPVQRPGPPRGPQPTQQPDQATNVNGSVAEVIPPAVAPTAPTHPLHRWSGAIEAVARNMVRGKGPDDTAATLEDLLNEEELKNLRGEQIDGVWHPTSTEALAWLESQGLGPFPQLGSPGGLIYLDSVLSEIRLPEEAESE